MDMEIDLVFLIVLTLTCIVLTVALLSALRRNDEQREFNIEMYDKLCHCRTQTEFYRGQCDMLQIQNDSLRRELEGARTAEVING